VVSTLITAADLKQIWATLEVEVNNTLAPELDTLLEEYLLNKVKTRE
jgi:hypothetical protein